MAKEYNYLLEMPLWSLTWERVEELENQKKDKENKLNNAEATSIEQMYVSDLDEFVVQLDQFEAQEEADRLFADKQLKKQNQGNEVKKKKRRKNNNNNDDDNKKKTKKNDDKKAKKPESTVSDDKTTTIDDKPDFLIPLKERMEKKMGHLLPHEPSNTKLFNKKKRKPSDDNNYMDIVDFFSKELP